MDFDPERLLQILTTLGALIDQLVNNHEEMDRHREHSYMLLATVISHVIEDMDSDRLSNARSKLNQLQTFYRNRADH